MQASKNFQFSLMTDIDLTVSAFVEYAKLKFGLPVIILHVFGIFVLGREVSLPLPPF